MGNLQLESNLKSVIYENSYKASLGLTDQEYVDKVNDGSYTNFVYDQVGFGLAQWTWWTRKQALLEDCKGRIGDLKCQLTFLWSELKQDYSSVYVVLKSSNSVEECTLKFMTEYERPAEPRQQIRLELAQRYYNYYTGTGPVENVHIVQEGDTLWEIAQKYGTTVEDLCILNNITNAGAIYIGQIIKLPN